MYISKLESDQKSLPLWQACLSLCRTISAFVVKDREDPKEEVDPVPIQKRFRCSALEPE